MDGNISFPTEIWIQIIQQLNLESYTSPYRRDQVSTIALAQLSLVSRAFNVLTEPVFYSTAFITPHTSESFSTAVASPQNRFDGTASENSAGKGVFVRSLALANLAFLEASHVRQIKTILDTVRSSVVCLFIDTSRVDSAIIDATICHDLDTTIRCALPTFSRIEELCLLHWDSYSFQLAPCTTLRRMVLANSFLLTDLLTHLSKMENLELCILAWPAGVQVDSPPEFGFNLREIARGNWSVPDEGRGAPQLVITVTSGFDLVVNLLSVLPEEAPGLQYNEAIRVMRPALMLVDVPEVRGGPQNPSKKRDWTTRVVLDGTIWERRREFWSSYIGRLHPS